MTTMTPTTAPTNIDSDRPGTPSPTVLDVDTGVDDALALMLACASPSLDLVAVTCVAGNTLLPDVVANTRAVMQLCGRPEVPVVAGAERSLVRPPTELDNVRVHGGAGRGYTVLHEELPPTLDQHAAQMIVDQARAHPGKLTLITTGPMTNVAVALMLEPRLPELVGQWIFMGGAYRTERGNTTPAAEFNIHADPEAAQMALVAFGQARTRPVAVGLDVTHQVRLMPHHIEKLAARAGDRFSVRPDGNPWGEPASGMLAYLEGAVRKYAEYHQDQHGFYGIYLHDPLTVAIATDRTLATYEPVAVAVECAGRLTAGQTVADWQRVWNRPPNLDVAVTIDRDRIFDTVIDRIGTLIALGQDSKSAALAR